MPLRFRNPYFKPPAQAARETVVASLAPQVISWLQAQNNNRIISMAELRAGVPAIAGGIDRETVNMLMQSINVPIDNPEDPVL